MAQFDVYKNPNPRTRTHYPYLVDIQSELLDDLASRVVVPLGHLSEFKHEVLQGLTPVVSIDDKKYLLLIPQLAALRKNRLQKPIGTIESLRHEIIAAVDLLVTGI